MVAVVVLKLAAEMRDRVGARFQQRELVSTLRIRLGRLGETFFDALHGHVDVG